MEFSTRAGIGACLSREAVGLVQGGREAGLRIGRTRGVAQGLRLQPPRAVGRPGDHEGGGVRGFGGVQGEGVAA
eukprot:1170934-Lingulodinium_polyedra.AAC.1